MRIVQVKANDFAASTNYDQNKNNFLDKRK